MAGRMLKLKVDGVVMEVGKLNGDGMPVEIHSSPRDITN